MLLMNDHDKALEKVRSLIKGIEIAMLTTVTSEGLVSRPMKTQELEFDGDLYFLTMKSTGKYEELQQNPHVNVVYVGASYVSIRGTAQLLDDREKIKEYWNTAYEKMLKTTSDDPNLILIKVHAETAEYWDTGNWLKSILELVYQLTGKESKETNINNQINLE
ncbi:general stress protein [Paenibacillus montaniterrae]|uniref:General stress protein n=2 Tax=Paenibacillus montaniterrae TaxID=429341 RepID=A0A919YMH3_9BACL|nr:general stress protein [Paenibacillus montaniterrae]